MNSNSEILLFSFSVEFLSLAECKCAVNVAGSSTEWTLQNYFVLFEYSNIQTLSHIVIGKIIMSMLDLTPLVVI